MSRFEFEAGGCQAVHAAPEEAVHGHHQRRHHYGCAQGHGGVVALSPTHMVRTFCDTGVLLIAAAGIVGTSGLRSPVWRGCGAMEHRASWQLRTTGISRAI